MKMMTLYIWIWWYSSISATGVPPQEPVVVHESAMVAYHVISSVIERENDETIVENRMFKYTFKNGEITNIEEIDYDPTIIE